jgi:hypothetical protein
MAYVICPLSDAGQARSVLGTAFQGVERIRIGQGERLTLLIWWNQGRSWTVLWHVGLEVGSVVLSAGQAACCSAGSALLLVVTDCSTLWTVPTPSKRPPADHDDGGAGHGHLQSGARTDRALAGAPVHPSAAIRSLARLGGQRSLMILLMGSQFGSEAITSWAYGPTVPRK